MTSDKRKNYFWAAIDSIETAKQAAQQGVWAAAFVAIITAILAMASVSLGGSLPQGMPKIDAWSFWDAGIFVAIAWGIHKMSRFAAVAGLVLYIVEQIVMRTSNPSLSGSGLFLVVFFVLAFINAVRGTFAYHRFRRAN